jgi:hypothetical protein
MYAVQLRSEIFEFTNKCNSINCILFSPRSETFGICLEKQLLLTGFCSAAQRKVLEFTNKSSQNRLCLVQPCSKVFWNLSRKATRILVHCIL